MKKRTVALLMASFLCCLGCGEKSKEGIVKETVVDNGRRIDVEVITTGYGATRQEATYDALNEAVKKVLGQQIDVKSLIVNKKDSENIDYSIKANAEVMGKKGTADIKIKGDLNKSTDEFKRTIVENTKGLVRTYDIVEEKEQKDKWFVRLRTTVIKNNTGQEASRIRIAIAPFGIENSSYKTFSGLVNKKLTEKLVQTQKFSVPDREYIKEQNLEKSLMNEKEMPVSELSKLGSKLAVDYIITGTVEKFGSTKHEEKSNITGNVLSTSTSQFAKVSFRLIDIATGMVKFTGLYDHIVSSGQSVEALSDKAADYIVDNIVSNLVPIFVEKVSGDTIYIAIGGDRLKPGQQLKIVQYLSEIKDSGTGEVLGNEEKDIGKAEVTDVQSKLTTAKIIDSIVDIDKAFKPRTFVIKPILVKTEKPKVTNKIEKKDIDKDSDW